MRIHSYILVGDDRRFIAQGDDHKSFVNSRDEKLRRLRFGNEASSRNPGILVNINLKDSQDYDIVEFLRAHTAPSLNDSACLAMWLPNTNDPDPNGQRLCGKDQAGKELLPGSCLVKR